MLTHPRPIIAPENRGSASGSLASRLRTSGVGLVALGAAALLFGAGAPASAAPSSGGTASSDSTGASGTVTTVNPMAAYRNWNVVTFGDTDIRAESEGAVAVGGTLTFTGTNVALQHNAGASEGNLGLLVGGGVDLAHSDGELRVLSGGTVGIADLTGLDALDSDGNGAEVDLKVVAAGAGYDSSPAITTAGAGQAASTVESPDGFTSRFTQSAAPDAAAQVAGAATATCNAAHVLHPATTTGRVSLELKPGVNYWNVSAADLSAVTELVFEGSGPSPDDPLVVNVTDGSDLTLDLTMSGTRKPEGILFNAPTVTTITQEGDTVDGSILAPKAAYTKTSANIQGTLVSASAVLEGSEEHFHPFAGSITECTDTAGPTDPSDPTDPSAPSDGPNQETDTSTGTTGSPTTDATVTTGDAGATASDATVTDRAETATPATDRTAQATLAATGGNVLPFGIIGGALLVAGFVSLLVARRRRTA